jgi:hypothetical protein
VFDLLEGQLVAQLDQLAEIVASDVPSFNTLLQSRGLQPIACSAVVQAGRATAASQRAEAGTAPTGGRARVGRHVG